MVMKKFGYLLMIFPLLLTATTGYASVEVKCFEREFVRGTGGPELITNNFLGIEGTATIRIYNGAEDDTAEKVSTSTIKANDVDVFSTNSFNQNVDYLEAEIPLIEGQNSISVELRGKPGGKIKVKVVQNLEADSTAVNVPTADPFYIVSGTSTPVTVSAYIPDTNLTASSVRLYKLNDADQPIALLGYLNDNGNNGDKTPGDKIFSGTFDMEEAEADVLKFCVLTALDAYAIFEIPAIVIPTILNNAQYDLLIEEIFNDLLTIQGYYQILGVPPTTAEQFSETLKLISEHLLLVYAKMQAIYYFETGPPEEQANWSKPIRKLFIAISKIVCANEAYADDNSNNTSFLGKLAGFLSGLGGLAVKNSEISNEIEKFGKDGTDPSVEHIADWVVANCGIVDESELSNPAYEWERKLCAKKYFETEPSSKYHEALDEASKIVVKKLEGQGTGLVGGGIGAIFQDSGVLISEGVSQGVSAGLDMFIDIFVIGDTGETGLLIGKVENGEEVEFPTGTHDIIYTFDDDQERAIVKEIPVEKGTSKTVDAVSGSVGAYVEIAVTGKIPDTGQTTSYTDTFGEDSDYTINPQSYTKLDASGNVLDDSAIEWAMVKDNVTRLIWEVKTDDSGIHDKDNTYTRQDAQDVFIAQLNADNYGGHSDWRLPTVKELSMLVNADKPFPEPAINMNYFSYTVVYYYWSSTFDASALEEAWGVDFQYGLVHPRSDSNYVRAVRGVMTQNNVVANGDGTLTDTSTGLIWQQVEPEAMTWTEALAYCENLQLAGYDDWRLPNRNELQSIFDYSTNKPAIDFTVFPDTVSPHYYWSSTACAYSGEDAAWLMRLGNIHGIFLRNTSYYVRAVRNVKSDTGFLCFSEQKIISTDSNGPWSISTGDLDNDGDLDIVSASIYDNKIAWYENNGNSTFGALKIISTSGNTPRSVSIADLDNDGNLDVISALSDGNKIVWYKNNGDDTFGNQQVISTNVDNPWYVYAADLDKDNLIDIISTSRDDNKIAWYKNNGNGIFGFQRIISTNVDDPCGGHIADIDNDGDLDILATSREGSELLLFTNNGDGTFGNKIVISNNIDLIRTVYSSDLDGDGNIDIITSSVTSPNSRIVWFKNNGDGFFGAENIIDQYSSDTEIHVKDIDLDGDSDLIVAMYSHDKLVYYLNNGDGFFGNLQLISDTAVRPISIRVEDLDNDGDVDILSASHDDNEIEWYENLIITK